jgi:hypothetical protein
MLFYQGEIVMRILSKRQVKELVLYSPPYYTTLLILVGISNQGETAAIGSDLSSFRI